MPCIAGHSKAALFKARRQRDSGNGALTAADPLAAASSRFVASGTNKVHYLTLGQGALTVLLVHGWAGHAKLWAEQVSVLTNKAKVMLVDLPGHGQSDRPRVPYTLDFFARAILDVLRDAQVERAALVGFSMGVPVICIIPLRAPAISS